MTTNWLEVNELAIELCEAKHGPGSWSKKHRKRARYLLRADKIIAARPKRHTRWQRLKAWLRTGMARYDAHVARVAGVK